MNPYKSEKFTNKFTLKQAQNLINNLPSVCTIDKTNITFGSNRNIADQMIVAGFIPSFILRNTNLDLAEGTMTEYGYPTILNKTGFLLDEKGNYLYDNYEEDETFFDSILEPILLMIDHDKQAFMFQYPHAVCVFGNSTGLLTSVIMD